MNFNFLMSAIRRYRSLLTILAAIAVITMDLPLPAAARPLDSKPDLQPGAPEAVIATDDYGYTLNTVTAAWIDLNAGNAVEVVFNLPKDDEVSAALPIGFTFKYYETPQTQYYVTTNGLVTFGGSSNSPNAKPFPWIPPPNNMIGPFWADHVVALGKVWRATLGAYPNRYTVVEWEIYADEGFTDLVTNFEAVLYENGDILFQYHVVPTPLPVRYTIGLEDANGVNGLQYFDPPAVSTALKFERPDPAERVNVMPRVQGRFTQNGTASFNFTVINNGEIGTDRYNITAVSSRPGWDYEFYLARSNSKLRDSDTDGKVDTGPLTMGESREITVIVSAPGAQPFEYTTLSIEAASDLGAKPSVSTIVQAAVPASFAQAYVDPYGIHFGQYWEVNTIDWTVSSTFTGPTLNMEAVSEKNYLAAWEYTPITQMAVSSAKETEPLRGIRKSMLNTPPAAPDADFYTEIFYRLVNRFTGSGTERILTESANLVAPVGVDEAYAFIPVIARAPSENIAIAWTQVLARTEGPDRETNSNIYLRILNSAGLPISGRFNVTGDADWYSDQLSHLHDFPTVMVTDDERNIVCWTEDYNRQVKCRSHTFNGSQIFPVGGIETIATTPNDALPLDLSLTRLSDGTNRTLVTYVQSPEDGNDSIQFAAINSNGAVSTPAQPLVGAEGGQPRAVQFSNGNILVVWSNLDGRLGYVYLDDDFSPLGLSGYLEKVNRRTADSPSVTLDNQGNVVITWMDGDDSDALFYALLDANGVVLSPPMTFLSSPLGNTEVSTSDYGFGNAAYTGIFQIFLPVARQR